jgi:hypothetical protein
VVEDEAGSPVHAHLWWVERNGRTTAVVESDRGGRFRFEGMGPEAGTLRVAAAGPLSLPFARSEVPDVAPGGAPLRVVLPRAPVLAGRFPDLAEGSTVGVSIYSRSHTSTRGTRVGPGGWFEIPHPEPGVPALAVFATTGSAPLLLEVPALSAGDRTDLGDLRPVAGRAVHGVVRDGTGRGVPFATARVAERWSDGREPDARVAFDGSYRLERMPLDRFEIRVEAPGFPSHVLSVPGGEGDTRFDPTIGSGGTLEAQVRDAEGNAVAGATVVVRPEGASPYDADFDATRQTFDTDAGGRLRALLQARRHVVSAYDADHGRRGDVGDVEIRAGETTTVTIGVR